MKVVPATVKLTPEPSVAEMAAPFSPLTETLLNWQEEISTVFRSEIKTRGDTKLREAVDEGLTETEVRVKLPDVTWNTGYSILFVVSRRRVSVLIDTELPAMEKTEVGDSGFVSLDTVLLGGAEASPVSEEVPVRVICSVSVT